MSTKLSRVLDEIEKTEGKIALWREHLEELHIRRKQLEDAEIIKSVRSMRLGGREMLAFLEGLQSGRVPIRQELPGMDAGQMGNAEGKAAGYNAPGETGEYNIPGNEPGMEGDNSGPDGAAAEREDRENEGKS